MNRHPSIFDLHEAKKKNVHVKIKFAQVWYYRQNITFMVLEVFQIIGSDLMSDRKHFVSMNSLDSSLAVINCGSVLGPLLSLLYIDDLYQAI